MFSYYGSKSKIINLYPSPKHGKVIEPFAGSARYALKYFDRQVLLVDKYSVLVEVWHYLQQASEADILGLPKPAIGDDLRTAAGRVLGARKNCSSARGTMTAPSYQRTGTVSVAGWPFSKMAELPTRHESSWRSPRIVATARIRSRTGLGLYGPKPWRASGNLSLSN